MGWLTRIFHKSREEKRLDSELRFHLEQQVADYVASGMSFADARRRARLEFGGLDQVKEQWHEEGRCYFLETLLQDVRYGLRMLRRSPGFTAVAVLTLALGIGANTAIFSMIDTIMLRPLPIQHPGEVTHLSFPRDATHFDPSFSLTEFRQLREQTHGVFADVTAMALGGLSGSALRADGLTVGTVTRPAQTLFVTGNFFAMLGIRPYLGRLILPSEGNTPGGDAVVVLSYRYWKKRFYEDPGVLNKSAMINGRPVTIVGIAAKDFLGPTPIVEMEAYLPLGMMTVETGGDAAFFSDPARRRFLVLGRLAPGVSLERANAALSSLGQQLVKQFPRPGEGTALHAKLLRPPGLIDGPNPLPALAGLFLMLSGLVLVLACLNIANLSLVRAASRRREMAVRAALGGGRVRLARQLLTETLLLALFGAVAGMIAGTLGLRGVTSAVTITELPVVFEFPFNARVFLYALGVAVVAAGIVGIIPALRASSGNLSDILHEGGRSSTARTQRTRSTLVVVEVGGALALLIVAGLFVRSLRSAEHADLGFDSKDVLNVKLDPGEIGYTQTQAIEFYRQLLTRVRALPGVQSASLATGVPLNGFSEDGVTIPGRISQRGEQFHAGFNAVSTDYFGTMQIPLLQGRVFLDSDTESSARVALIDETMADRFWHGSNPIGRSFRRNGDPQHTFEVVGIVKKCRTEDTYSPYNPVFYIPISQGFSSAQTLQTRTTGSPEALAPALLTVIRELAPAAPVLGVRAMDDEVMNGPDGLLVFNLGAELTAALGLLGLTLAVVGIYGVMAYAVGQRTQEIGVRLALGAQRASILWMISRQGLAIVGYGLALGLLLAFGLGRLVGDFLVGVGSRDPLTFLSVPPMLAFVALLACYVPARRAMRVDPMRALRHE